MIRNRNVDPLSLLRPKPENTRVVRLPEADVDAIIAGSTTAVGVKTLNGTGIFANGEIPFPYQLCFTLGTNTDQFTYEVDGFDHVGNRIVAYRNSKNTTAATSSTSGGTNPRPICWSKITRFEIVSVENGGLGTLDVGFTYTTAATLIPRIPLPWQLIGGVADLAGVKFIDQGGGTIVPAPPSNLTLGTLAEGGYVLPVTFTTVTVLPSLPMGFAVTLKQVVAASRP